MKKYKIGDLIFDPSLVKPKFDIKTYVILIYLMNVEFVNCFYLHMINFRYLPHIILAFGIGITAGYVVKRYCF